MQDVILNKLRHFCAYQERCHEEVRTKLLSLKVYGDTLEEIINKLIEEDFLNEERFAKAFAGGKFRIKKWGRVKIKIELKKRKISDYCIKKGMQEIDEDEYIKTLKSILVKKLKENPKGKEQVRNYKAAQYAMSRGFEGDLVLDILRSDSQQGD